MMPLHKQEAQIGCCDKIPFRIDFQAVELYSFAFLPYFSDLFPPCFSQEFVPKDLASLHPRKLHSADKGILGIKNSYIGR
jgi:hypothetical protein